MGQDVEIIIFDIRIYDYWASSFDEHLCFSIFRNVP